MRKEFNLISQAVKTAEVSCNFLPFGKVGEPTTGKFAFFSLFAFSQFSRLPYFYAQFIKYTWNM
jgi:hypothetical protein